MLLIRESSEKLKGHYLPFITYYILNILLLVESLNIMVWMTKWAENWYNMQGRNKKDFKKCGAGLTSFPDIVKGITPTRRRGLIGKRGINFPLITGQFIIDRVEKLYSTPIVYALESLFNNPWRVFSSFFCTPTSWGGREEREGDFLHYSVF